MAVALVSLALVALLLFIVGERRRDAPSVADRRRHAPAASSNEVATARNVARSLLGLALVAIALGFSTWLNPPARPYTGRWSWAKEALFSVLGPAGPALFWAGVAAALVLAARGVWRHTMKKPTDRLFW